MPNIVTSVNVSVLLPFAMGLYHNAFNIVLVDLCFSAIQFMHINLETALGFMLLISPNFISVESRVHIFA